MKFLSLKDLTVSELAKISGYIKLYPWEDKEAYADFLSNAYHFLGQAHRLLKHSAYRCEEHFQLCQQPLNEWSDQKKALEALISADLNYLNKGVRPLPMSLPPLWQTQFYMVENHSPLSCLGSLLYYEFLTSIPEVAAEVFRRSQRAHGPKATTYLKAEWAPFEKCMGQFSEVIRQLPDPDVEHIRQSLMITSSLYRNFFLELYTQHMGSRAS